MFVPDLSMKLTLAGENIAVLFLLSQMFKFFILLLMFITCLFMELKPPGSDYAVLRSINISKLPRKHSSSETSHLDERSRRGQWSSAREAGPVSFDTRSDKVLPTCLSQPIVVNQQEGRTEVG